MSYKKQNGDLPPQPHICPTCLLDKDCPIPGHHRFPHVEVCVNYKPEGYVKQLLATITERDERIRKLDIECIEHKDRIVERDDQIESMAMHWNEVELGHMNRIEALEADLVTAHAALRPFAEAFYMLRETMSIEQLTNEGWLNLPMSEIKMRYCKQAAAVLLQEDDDDVE